MFRPIVLPFLIKKASLALPMESLSEKFFSMGFNSMSLAVWGATSEYPATHAFVKSAATAVRSPVVDE